MGFASDAGAQVGKCGASDFEEKRAVNARRQGGKTRLREEFVDRGNLAQEIRLFRGQNTPGLHRHADISSQEANEEKFWRRKGGWQT